jgi:methylenetetrahydrofolate reductase (NADPH)
MKITDHLARATNRTLFSFEILPPMKGQTIQHLYHTIAPLLEFKPPFIDVTYHREEVVYRPRPEGGLERRAIWKRPGTVAICAALQNKFGVDTVPHLICGGFTREETENALLELHFLGIDNVLCLRGDAIRSLGQFAPEVGGHNYASELVTQVAALNRGEYLDEEQASGFATNFCIGVAGYPEKHFESPSPKTDLAWLKQKIDNGAEYIVTQMFFDNARFFEFERRCRAIGITVPIIPGLKPITTKGQVSTLPRSFYLDLPDDLTDGVLGAPDNAAVRQIGIEWCIQQSRELIAHGVPCLHYYSMGKADAIGQIARAVF